MIKDKLELAETIQIDRVHGFNAKLNSPTVARCTFYKDEENIMKEKRKQKGSGLFIGDVFFCESERLKKEAGTAFESSQGPKEDSNNGF